MKKIVIVGLGLIGGSMAMALRNFEEYTVVGVDVSEPTLRYAGEHGICDELTRDMASAVKDADVTLFALHPAAIIEAMETQKDNFKPGSLVTDVCGIKKAIMDASACLPPDVDFIGCHPMAGTEFSGIEHALSDMFHDAHLILTPKESNTSAHLAFMERLAAHIGCRDVVKTTPEKHDMILAYTSQMMHMIAVSVCDDENLFTCRGFEGSSFRSCTRVAALDVELWTELFSLNADALIDRLDELLVHLTQYRDVLASGDRRKLSEKLAYSAERKREMLLPGADLM